MENDIGMRENIIRTGMILIAAGIWLCGCGRQETSKTIILPEKTEDRDIHSGIDVRNIEEYTFEGGIRSVTWKKDSKEELCVILDGGELLEYRIMNVYADTMSEGVIFEEHPVGMAELAPGGQYILYEAVIDNLVQLTLYRTETGEKQVVREWEDSSERFLFKWCGDGTRFVAWQDKDYDGQAAYSDYLICRHDAQTGEKTEVAMNEDGYMWRQVFPNEDGSKVYVRESYMSENEAAISEDRLEEMYGITDADTAETEGYEQPSQARSRLVDMDTLKVEELDEEKAGIAYPARYANQGVIGINGNEVWLAAAPLGQSEKKKILTANRKDICICKEGDHIFLADWDQETTYFQIMGIRLRDGEIVGRQILYRNTGGVYAGMLAGENDQELIIHTSEYTKRGERNTQMTVLEY